MGPKHDLNGQNTVFARVIHGMDILYVAQKIPVQNEEGRPLKDIVIADCGELLGKDKYTKDEAKFLPTYDDYEEPTYEEEKKEEVNEARIEEVKEESKEENKVAS